MTDNHGLSAGPEALASKGGKARAASLGPERRKEIAREAALARWSDLPHATHDGTLIIGEQEIVCAVLEDRTRVLNQETFLTALGRAAKAKGQTGAEKGGMPPFLAAANLQPFISDELKGMAQAIPFRTRTGGRAWGYRAEMLPEVCDVYLAARDAGQLLSSQQRAATAAEILVRGLARLGILALVDEATGYQEERARQELQQILNYYVLAELRPWTKMFPDEFFREVYRLNGWEYRPGSAKRTPLVGKLINKYIYEQLPPGVLEELQRRNPVVANGRRRRKHHQHLTPSVGHPHLDRQISTVTTLMRISNSKEEFTDLFERAFPPPQMRLPLRIEVPGPGVSPTPT
jgi:hypothetical protein